jgi:hypothetical protein
MRRNTIGTSVMLAGILLLPLLIVVDQETTSLLIEGPQGHTKVVAVLAFSNQRYGLGYNRVAR